MAQKERDIINWRLAGLAPNERLFRINAGMGWIAEKKNTAIIKNKNGGINVYLKNARPFHGAPEGWPDLCGWQSVEITPDMVGRHVAVFVGEEIKTSGHLRVWQSAFKEIIERMGGVFRVIK